MGKYNKPKSVRRQEDFLYCPKCGALVNSEYERGTKRRYFCMDECGWGSWKKPKSVKPISTKGDKQ